MPAATTPMKRILYVSGATSSLALAFVLGHNWSDLQGGTLAVVRPGSALYLAIPGDAGPSRARWVGRVQSIESYGADAGPQVVLTFAPDDQWFAAFVCRHWDSMPGWRGYGTPDIGAGGAAAPGALPAFIDTGAGVAP